VLRARVEEVRALYNKLEADNLIQEAFKKREIKRYAIREFIAETYNAR
jgi:hypothetical protein